MISCAAVFMLLPYLALKSPREGTPVLILNLVREGLRYTLFAPPSVFEQRSGLLNPGTAIFYKSSNKGQVCIIMLEYTFLFCYLRIRTFCWRQGSLKFRKLAQRALRGWVGLCNGDLPCLPVDGLLLQSCCSACNFAYRMCDVLWQVSSDDPTVSIPLIALEKWNWRFHIRV